MIDIKSIKRKIKNLMQGMLIFIAIVAILVVMILIGLKGYEWLIGGRSYKEIKRFTTEERAFLEKTCLIELPEGAVIKNITTVRGRDNETLYAKIEIPKNRLEDFDSKIGFSYEEESEGKFARYEASYPWWSRFRRYNINKESIIKVIRDTNGGGRITYVDKDIDSIELFLVRGNVDLNAEERKLFRYKPI